MIAPSVAHSESAAAPRKRLVLIVDDLPENLQVLAGHLTKAGYEILAAPSGARAIALVRNRKPDLILLDIMMPIMDGLEVCRALKADAESADIPVIFITARADTDDVLQGFQLGAVDYITKPFKSDELVARVRTHLDLKAARDMLLTYNHQLERLSKHLKRLNEDKNRFLGIVSHDIRGAFGNVVSVSRLFAEPPTPPVEDMSDLLRDIGVEAEHMIALAQNLLNIDALERRQLTLLRESVETGSLIDFAINAHQLAAKVKGLNFFATADGSMISGDITACRQILTNLVSNAVKYSVPHSNIWLDARADGDGGVVLTVRDEGPGLSTEDQRQLFRPFTRLGARSASHEHSVGLGLSIVKLMAEGMNGSVRCDSQFGAGATFAVTLPALDQAV